MPLPFILGAAALAAAGYGAKKAYDGYEDKTAAENITQDAKNKYDTAEKNFLKENDFLSNDLEKLGELQLQIGQDFAEFRKLSEELLAKINQAHNSKDLNIHIPQHRLNEIKKFEFSTTTYLAQVAGGGAVGAAAAYATYGGVMALGAASTGTPIAALSGIAAKNAALAALGGGSIASGGLGIAGGTAVLSGVVAAPILAIAGWAYASHAEKALSHACNIADQVDAAIKKFDASIVHFKKIRTYVDNMHFEIKRIYLIFQQYFAELKKCHEILTFGGNIDLLEDKIIQAVENGYMVAAILTDIITTPLFKTKTDENGQVLLDENQNPQIETDENDLQVLNTEGIDAALNKAQNDMK
ncbi:MAG: hypothetical protein Q4B82_06490 [Alysiella sp.]|uniref:hypothetical protein n=1 Tax=Alysiella sp. TaxID=1872483 RepID=UPI0026DBD4FA|nr:hypothetical protein [Alysiella sp.]MDO4434210.1 hypothetical protein [Alysiella sp.]